ncbi:DUF2786 domain-containing protein [Pseudonocardia asaccharolytica]|uniref:Uncharacterized protein n=1 Tax=Pseudonocardia asaccharolytica DSM 44247 = NBRC 16224 TaxID=1123024 RepID=A0A511CVQ3_9PSEU|nr:DUF2786 domain-containing protein [Pseudonocardia asaccharolytica]GEL16631.1 hypothetical protein PA7_04680 [Pseudonocardia asaccharolytica DSM 44247 = NBRC 16224]
MGDALDRIRKLLAKAERAGTEAEAAIYNEKAVALMARHGVDAALLAAADPGRDTIGTVRIAMADPYSAGKARLLGWTAAALRCRWVLHGAYRGKVSAVSVVGYASDRERVALLYTSLLLQATSQLVRLRPPRPGESVAAYRRSWLHGFAAQVHDRLRAAEEAAARAASGGRGPAPDARPAALVLLDREAQVARAYAEAFPNLGRAGRATLSGSGFADGAVAGRRADLGRGRIVSRPALEA